MAQKKIDVWNKVVAFAVNPPCPNKQIDFIMRNADIDFSFHIRSVGVDLKSETFAETSERKPKGQQKNKQNQYEAFGHSFLFPFQMALPDDKILCMRHLIHNHLPQQAMVAIYFYSAREQRQGILNFSRQQVVTAL